MNVQINDSGEGVMRHIVNLKYEQTKKRFYLMWTGDTSSSGEAELKTAMMHIEETVGPEAKNAEDFYSTCINFFQQKNFQLFKS